MTNRSWAALLVLCVTGGCSPPDAIVSGRVSADGQPVTGGSIVLAPIGTPGNPAPGKPGASEIAPDGGFALTLQPGRKGLAGRYTVRFTPPVLPPMPEAEARVTIPPYQGFVPTKPDVEVRPGENRIDIELFRAGKP